MLCGQGDSRSDFFSFYSIYIIMKPTKIVDCVWELPLYSYSLSYTVINAYVTLQYYQFFFVGMALAVLAGSGMAFAMPRTALDQSRRAAALLFSSTSSPGLGIQSVFLQNALMFTLLFTILITWPFMLFSFAFYLFRSLRWLVAVAINMEYRRVDCARTFAELDLWFVMVLAVSAGVYAFSVDYRLRQGKGGG